MLPGTSSQQQQQQQQLGMGPLSSSISGGVMGNANGSGSRGHSNDDNNNNNNSNNSSSVVDGGGGRRSYVSRGTESLIRSFALCDSAATLRQAVQAHVETLNVEYASLWVVLVTSIARQLVSLRSRMR